MNAQLVGLQLGQFPYNKTPEAQRERDKLTHNLIQIAESIDSVSLQLLNQWRFQ
jgi:hypothetical protein